MKWPYGTWRYGIVKRGDIYSVHEVYIDDEYVTGWTSNPIAAEGDSRQDVIRELKRMLRDARKHPAIDGTEES